MIKIKIKIIDRLQKDWLNRDSTRIYHLWQSPYFRQISRRRRNLQTFEILPFQLTCFSQVFRADLKTDCLCCETLFEWFVLVVSKNLLAACLFAIQSIVKNRNIWNISHK